VVARQARRSRLVAGARSVAERKPSPPCRGGCAPITSSRGGRNVMSGGCTRGRALARQSRRDATVRPVAVVASRAFGGCPLAWPVLGRCAAGGAERCASLPRPDPPRPARLRKRAP